MYRYSTGETLADCRYEYLETRIYINTSGEEVYKYEYTGYGYSHNYTYSYEPKGDTCADGVICIANCLNCGNHFEMMMFNPCNDGNADGFCDVCDTEISIPECEQHNDFNSDGICDDCGEEFYCECVDENGDTYCDYCQAYVEPMKK